MTREQLELIRDLLAAHLTNLDGHAAAILELPELAEDVREEGWDHVDEQAALTRSALEAVEVLIVEAIVQEPAL